MGNSSNINSVNNISNRLNCDVDEYEVGSLDWPEGMFDSDSELPEKIQNCELPEALISLGKGYMKDWDFRNALACFKKSVVIQDVEDTSKAAALLNLGLYYRRNEKAALAKMAIRNALEIYNRKCEPLGKAHALNQMGMLRMFLAKNNGDREKARDLFHESLTISEENSCIEWKAESLFGLGVICRLLGDLENGKKQLEGCLALCEQIESKEQARFQQAQAQCHLGTLQQRAGKYDEALELLDLAKTQFESLGCPCEEMECVNNEGSVFVNMKSYSRARKCFLQAVKFYEHTSNKWGWSLAHNNVGITYLKQNELENASTNFILALRGFDEIGSLEGKASVLGNLGDVHCKRGDFEKSVKFLQQSLKWRRKLGDNTGVASVLFLLSEVYSKMSKFQEAIRCMRESLAIVDKMGNVIYRVRSLKQLGLLYEKNQEFERALENLENALEIYEKLKDDKNVEEIKVHCDRIMKAKREKYESEMEKMKDMEDIEPSELVEECFKEIIIK